jgi:hypothetical protein
VLELAEGGASQRAIAREVFGDARYRGRVERMLRAQAAASNGSAKARNSRDDKSAREDFTPASDLELLHELVSRAEKPRFRGFSSSGGRI